MNRRPNFTLPRLLAEMKRRGIYSVLAAYAVAAWVVLQVGEVTFEPLGFPAWAMRLLIVLAIAGFVVVFALTWVFQITPQGIRRDTGAEDRAADAAKMALRPSIAVLPFIDMSPEQDQQYFCEGVAEEILNALSKIPNLNVAARSSSFHYRGDIGDVREVGRALGVATILEGSVRKSADRLRVAAQLVDTANGYHRWSETFDEDPKDIFEIQDEIATCIARCLLDTLTPTQESALKTTSSSDFTAYDYYLRGRQFFRRFNKHDIEFARQMFRRAIRIDPEFARGWAGYADCYSFLIMYADPKRNYALRANYASRRALELDPGLAEAHASRGLACLVNQRFGEAEKEFQTALELNPNLFEAYYYYGRARFHQGDSAMAAELFRKAADVDPDDFQSRLLRVQILRGLGRLEDARHEAKEAIAAVERQLEWHPDDTRALHLGAGSLIVLGDNERARRWMERAVEIDPHDSVLLYNLACNYATLGEIDMAMAYLEQAVDNGMVSLSWILNDEDIAPIRSHARYGELLERLEEMSRASGTAA